MPELTTVSNATQVLRRLLGFDSRVGEHHLVSANIFDLGRL